MKKVLLMLMGATLFGVVFSLLLMNWKVITGNETVKTASTDTGKNPVKTTDSAKFENNKPTVVATKPSDALSAKGGSTVSSTSSVESLAETGSSNTQAPSAKYVSILNIVLNDDIDNMDDETATGEIERIESYIEQNSVYNTLNSGKVSDSEMQEYAKLFQHLTRVRERQLNLHIASLQQEIKDQAQAQVSLNQQYENGDFYNEEKYGKKAVEEAVQKLQQKLAAEEQEKNEKVAELLKDPTKDPL